MIKKLRSKWWEEVGGWVGTPFIHLISLPSIKILSVYRQTDRLTDRQTDRETDRVSCRGASLLKKRRYEFYTFYRKN